MTPADPVRFSENLLTDNPEGRILRLEPAS